MNDSKWSLVPIRCSATLNDKNDQCPNVADATLVLTGAKHPDDWTVQGGIWAGFCSKHPVEPLPPIVRLYLYDPSQGEPDDPETWARRCGFASHRDLERAWTEQQASKIKEADR